jgi:hypothetical protein
MKKGMVGKMFFKKSESRDKGLDLVEGVLKDLTSKAISAEIKENKFFKRSSISHKDFGIIICPYSDFKGLVAKLELNKNSIEEALKNGNLIDFRSEPKNKEDGFLIVETDNNSYGLGRLYSSMEAVVDSLETDLVLCMTGRLEYYR